MCFNYSKSNNKQNTQLSAKINEYERRINPYSNICDDIVCKLADSGSKIYNVWLEAPNDIYRTHYGVREQFPAEVEEKTKELYPNKMLANKKLGRIERSLSGY